MKIINTDGMALVGPGSEWFWTAVSGLVLAGTFIAIYRQLRLQRSASEIDQIERMDRDWNSELLVRCRFSVVTALRDGVEPAKVPVDAADEIGNFWERVGYLVRMGHIDRRLVYEYMSNQCRMWWSLLLPMTRRLRELEGTPRAWEHFEWIAGVMAEMDRKAGSPETYDQAYLARTLPGRLESLERQIRTAEDLRAVIVRPMSTATLELEQAPSPAAG